MKEQVTIPLMEIKSNCRSFQWEGEPELIHVIKTGFRNRYMIVHEDAYELSLGKVEFMSKEEIKQIYKIDV
jgi:hypothetical protein